MDGWLELPVVQKAKPPRGNEEPWDPPNRKRKITFTNSVGWWGLRVPTRQDSTYTWIVKVKIYTPWNYQQTARENGPKPKRKLHRLPTIYFQVQTVSFREGRSLIRIVMMIFPYCFEVGLPSNFSMMTSHNFSMYYPNPSGYRGFLDQELATGLLFVALMATCWSRVQGEKHPSKNIISTIAIICICSRVKNRELQNPTWASQRGSWS